ncbi:MAG: Inositol 2-dehydrogenase [candidate division BRC1 bacterium ADurb.BinA364]|nr:MAG: Inositol 2-dehydrogenase [candidate division BRC1 bacterium ADurb.BinA364]
MSADKLKVGVIGIGGLAKSTHLPAIHEIEGIEIVALCDLIEERATAQAEKYGVAKTYVLCDEMLEKETLDAVFVLVEPCSLFHVVRRCLSKGIPAFMEKPPGITSYQCQSLARLSREKGVPLQVGFNRRYIPLVQKVLDFFHATTEITQIEGRFMKCGSAAFDRGGLKSLESDVIHCIDLVRYIAAAEPAAAATVDGWTNDVCVNRWNSVLRFENGVTGVIQSNYQTGGRTHTFEIHGPGASAFINLGTGERGCDATILTTKGKMGYSLASKGPGATVIEKIDGMALAGSQEFHRYYGFYQEDNAFIQAVRDRKPVWPDIHDAVKTYAMIDLMERNILA